MTGLLIEDLTARDAETAAPVLRGVSLHVPAGRSHALIGDAGSGKSSIIRTVLGITAPSLESHATRIRVGETDLPPAPAEDRRMTLARTTAQIPQDGRAALNPFRPIGAQIVDRLVRILGHDGAEALSRTRAALDAVEVPDPAGLMARFPGDLDHDLLRRVLIAAAFAGDPPVIFADAPTARLDGLRQRHHLRLLGALQAARGTTLILATRDPAVAARLCQRASVLFEGAVVEDADMRTLLAVPAHPYAQALINVTRRHDDPRSWRAAIPPSVIAATRAGLESRDV